MTNQGRLRQEPKPFSVYIEVIECPIGVLREEADPLAVKTEQIEVCFGPNEVANPFDLAIKEQQDICIRSHGYPYEGKTSVEDEVARPFALGWVERCRDVGVDGVVDCAPAPA